MAQQNGDPPDQHVMPGIERVPAPPTMMARTLRDIGVPDASDTARKISKGGFMLAPAQPMPPRRKPKIIDVEPVASSAEASQSEPTSQNQDNGSFERDTAADATLLRRGDWTLGQFRFRQRTRYSGPRPHRALFYASLPGMALVAGRLAAIMLPLAISSGPANLGDQPVPSGQIETGSVSPPAPLKPVEPERRVRPKAQKAPEQPNLIADIWRCIGPQGAEPDAAKQKKKSCERATPKF